MDLLGPLLMLAWSFRSRTPDLYILVSLCLEYARLFQNHAAQSDTILGFRHQGDAGKNHKDKDRNTLHPEILDF